MPHKDQATYVKLFKEIRGALEAEFGNIGGPKTVVMDFEVAAHNAIEEIFPEWTVKCCYFHFIKNIKDQAKKKKVPNLIRKSDAFKLWINRIFG